MGYLIGSSLKEKFAALARPSFSHERPSLSRRSRIRVGFVASQGHEGGFIRGMAQIVRRLDPHGFEPFVFSAESTFPACRAHFADSTVHCVSFLPTLPDASETIRSAKCDILYHWQVGTDRLSYFLPFTRCAPIQCTGFGMHGTTGMEEVDAFISSRFFERPDSGEGLHRDIGQAECTAHVAAASDGPRRRHSCGIRSSRAGNPVLLPPKASQVSPRLRRAFVVDSRSWTPEDIWSC